MTIKPTFERPHMAGSGTQRIYRFDNGLGASVVPEFGPGLTLTGGLSIREGLWELAVIRFVGDEITDFELTYDTRITDDVIRRIDAAEVEDLLAQIRDLPASAAEAADR